MPADQVAHLRQVLQGLEDVIAIVLILLGAVVVARLSAVVIRRTILAPPERLLDEARRRTLQPLLESLVRYVVYVIALLMILRRLNVDATAILASAGAIGVALGLGAQHVIRDVLAGAFLISEGLIHVGDVITFDTHTGTVERISVRTTQIRTASGELWTIPNGRLEVFGNKGPASGAPR